MKVIVYEVFKKDEAGWCRPCFGSIREVNEYIAGKIALFKMNNLMDLTKEDFRIIPIEITETVENCLRYEFGDEDYERYQKMKEQE